MDSADMCAAVSSGDDNQLVKKKRLRLRKTAIQPPTMQGRDKPRPKKIAKQQGPNADRASSNMAPHRAKRRQREAQNSPSMLRFKCSQCTDNLEFVPQELVRHFQEIHKGNLPDFCCNFCSFSAHEFSYLQVHQLSHKDTFSSCNICKDNVQRTLLEYCTHLTSCHSQKGRFSCKLCDTFSTGNVHVFLQHLHLHDLPTEESSGVDLPLHTIDFMKPVRSKTSGHSFQCQVCGYKGPSKRLITKHMNTVHGGQTVNQNMKKIHHITNNSHQSPPKLRSRVTRNTARAMHWLSQDCLSLPGREFLDKYCSLSNPERTREETQQFLVRSAVGETDNQKWTKALQSVLSNFPQDINVHPNLENTMMSNSSKDVTVLMVKNKLKVPQNAGSIVKKTTTPEKLETCPSGSATLEAHCVCDPNKGQPQLGTEETHCPGTLSNINEDSSMAAQPESTAGGPIQENRENEELRLHQNVKEHSKYSKELKCDNSCEDGLCAAKEPKMANKRDSRRPQRKYRSRRGRRKAKTRPKALEKGPQGLGLKLVLKKDPVKNKQWMSQSPLFPPDGCAMGGPHGAPLCLSATEKQGQTLVNGPLAENSKVSLKECGKDSKTDTGITIRPQFHGQPVADLASGNGVVQANYILVASDDNKDPKSLSTSTTEGAENSHISKAPCGVLEKNNEGMDSLMEGRKESTTNEDMNPLRNNGAISSHAAKPLIPPPGAGLPVHSSQPAISHPSELEDHRSPRSQTTSKGPSFTSSEGLWWVAPRAMERTLKLTPLSLGQAVKRPRGEQPVVVLNHPDADAPEVVRLMEAVQKHRGDVQRVVLSHQTLEAIAASDGSMVQGGSGPSRPPPPPPTSSSSSSSSSTRRSNSVRERFLLKLRLRRTSRSKYRVIRAVADRMDPVVIFRCWFCGRVFVSQDLWIAHRQRHLLEWKRPNCEKTKLSPTLEK